MRRYLILLFFTSILISCKTRESSPAMTDIRMSVDKRIISDIDLSLCDTILLENSDEALMYNVDQILPGNNEICIWGRNKASLFRYDGSFIKDLGTKGRGPGEYLDINSLFRQNNLYCIYDWQNRNILKYDAEGNFIGDE